MKIPADAQLGEIGDGFKQMLITLDGGRISIAAMALGLAQGALDCALSYAADRIQFGKPIASFQGVQHILADMATEVEAARLLVYEASAMKDAGIPFSRISSIARSKSSREMFCGTSGNSILLRIVHLIWNNASYAALGLHHNTRISWDDVNMCVLDCLTGMIPAIHSNVVAVWCIFLI